MGVRTGQLCDRENRGLIFGPEVSVTVFSLLLFYRKRPTLRLSIFVHAIYYS